MGLLLGIEDNVLDNIMDEEQQNKYCLRKVILMWCQDAQGLPNHEKYPLSWEGFRSLLEDCNKSDAAREYFEFLEKMP